MEEAGGRHRRRGERGAGARRMRRHGRYEWWRRERRRRADADHRGPPGRGLLRHRTARHRIPGAVLAAGVRHPAPLHADRRHRAEHGRGVRVQRGQHRPDPQAPRRHHLQRRRGVRRRGRQGQHRAPAVRYRRRRLHGRPGRRGHRRRRPDRRDPPHRARPRVHLLPVPRRRRDGLSRRVRHRRLRDHAGRLRALPARRRHDHPRQPVQLRAQSRLLEPGRVPVRQDRRQADGGHHRPPERDQVRAGEHHRCRRERAEGGGGRRPHRQRGAGHLARSHLLRPRRIPGARARRRPRAPGPQPRHRRRGDREEHLRRQRRAVPADLQPGQPCVRRRSGRRLPVRPGEGEGAAGRGRVPRRLRDHDARGQGRPDPAVHHAAARGRGRHGEVGQGRVGESGRRHPRRQVRRRIVRLELRPSVARHLQDDRPTAPGTRCTRPPRSSRVSSPRSRGPRATSRRPRTRR